MYNFDEKVDRINTKAVKYEEMDLKFGRSDLIPFWVADMDFKSPPFMIDAIKKRAEHGIFGYTMRTEDYYGAVADWLQKRHNVTVNKNDLEYGPGVVFILNIMIRLFTKEGDKIIMQSPVYYPFKSVIEKNKRILSDNVLVLKGSHYEIDFDDLTEKAKDPGCTMMLLCSPHNPVGRVWKEEELRKMVHICKENNVLLISDEIHFDLVFKPHTHYSLGRLDASYDDHVIVCTAPSKTFNIAGLHSAYCIIRNSRMMHAYRDELGLLDLNRSNVFSMEVTQAVYEKGAAYVDELIAYLEMNMTFVNHYIEKNIPGIQSVPIEATYLMWLDCRNLGLSADELDDLFINKAKLALDSGHWFGDTGRGFMRLNIACPRSMLEEGLEKLRSAIEKSAT